MATTWVLLTQPPLHESAISISGSVWAMPQDIWHSLPSPPPRFTWTSHVTTNWLTSPRPDSLHWIQGYTRSRLSLPWTPNRTWLFPGDRDEWLRVIPGSSMLWSLVANWSNPSAVLQITLHSRGWVQLDWKDPSSLHEPDPYWLRKTWNLLESLTSP